MNADVVGQFAKLSRNQLGKPLSDELKWNVVHFYKESLARVRQGKRKYSQEDIGRKASPADPVHRNTVNKIVQSWQFNGCLNQNGRCGGPRLENTKLDIWAKEFILDSLFSCPTLTLEEYQIRLLDHVGVRVHQSTIGRFFKDVRLPLKLVQRKCTRAFTADNVIYHGQFITFMVTVDSRRLRFYDETSVTGRPYGRTRARAPTGIGVTVIEDLPDNFRWSLCGLTCVKPGWQPLEVMASEDTQTAYDVMVTFRTWCARGVFEHGDIVVMDRAGTHSVDLCNILAELLALYGVMLIFTPKYSPELNPIELAWNKLKYILRYKYYRTTKWESFASLLEACLEITSIDMCGFYRHCGSGW